ncbi:MAG: hypothetical protein ACK47B_02605 [Armatimonadota bacterium]
MHAESSRSRAVSPGSSDLSPEEAPALPASPDERDGGSFPTGPAWEITEEQAWRWFIHRFRDLCRNPAFLARASLDEHELLLLVYDLGCYEQQCLRWLRAPEVYPRPPSLSEYLSPGREEWGVVARLVRELREAEDAE